MEWVDQAHDYLIDRMKERKNLWTAGMKLLSRWIDYPLYTRQVLVAADKIISDGVDVYDKDNQQCKIKLTKACVAIGKEYLAHAKCTRRFTNIDYAHVGCLILEAFVYVGKANIETPPPRTSTPAYVVFPFMEPPNVLRGLYSEQPQSLEFRQEVKFEGYDSHPVYTIKRWTSEQDRAKFDTMKNSEAFKAAEKLMKIGWKVNPMVLAAVDKQPEMFFDPHCKSDENASKEIEYERTMATARTVRDHTFYFSPEFDYRGRIYFTCPFFNFQGSDLARGLLLFSEKKYVTDGGLRWMKIHAASSYNQSYKKHSLPEWCTSDYKTHLDNEGLDDISVDKMTLEDRELWVDNNWQLIKDTVEKNLIHDCEKPVSFLAVAHEIVNYHNANGFYFSHLPIPIDGSNNGWQHLGAISRDKQTAKLVGLTPVDIQQDFYVQTAKTLKAITKKARNIEILEQMPMKKIRKGISKRGSMTRAYSAGAGKIAENMFADCKKNDYHVDFGIKEEDCLPLARDLIKAIDEVCPGPLKTMKFFQKLAEEQIEKGITTLTWLTPSGFWVEYEAPYENTPTVPVRIRVEDEVKKIGLKILLLREGTAQKRKFMCGISPNFIHSQDAAHMAKVICNFDGDFGAVHDSFSTHASDVDNLLEITKDEFVGMYDTENYFDDIVFRLSPDSSVQQPDQGTLNIGDIYESDYFFA